MAELTVADRSAVGQSSTMDCTQSAANWEMIGATSTDGILPVTIPGSNITSVADINAPINDSVTFAHTRTCPNRGTKMGMNYIPSMPGEFY